MSNVANAPKVDGYSRISFWREGDVGVVTILSPGNIDKVLIQEMVKVMAVAAIDDKVKSILLTGSNYTFSKGLDLPPTPNYADLRDYYDNIRNLILFLISMEKPIFAAVNGSAINAGLSLALLCDEIFYSDNSKIVLDESEPHVFLSTLTFSEKIDFVNNELIIRGKKVGAENMMSEVIEIVKELEKLPYDRKRRYSLNGFETVILQEELDFLDFYLWCEGCK